MASSSNSTEVTPPWLELPREVMAMILQKLDVVEILTTVEKVCPTWRSVCQDPAMWRRIHMLSINWKYNSEKMCREAVDRSQGQLIDISIHGFGSDDLLLYILCRSPNLRRLRILYCDKITDEGLSEAIKNFPLLEELHLHYVSAGIATIRSVGRHCPHLKLFKFNRQWTKWPLSGRNMNPKQLHDEVALAIAENMPELLHLQLIGNNVTDEGVHAILEGCPHLESLDLRHCFNVDMKGSLVRLCRQRIKDLRRPYDYVYDYEFWSRLLSK